MLYPKKKGTGTAVGTETYYNWMKQIYSYNQRFIQNG